MKNKKSVAMKDPRPLFLHMTLGQDQSQGSEGEAPRDEPKQTLFLTIPHATLGSELSRREACFLSY